MKKHNEPISMIESYWIPSHSETMALAEWFQLTNTLLKIRYKMVSQFELANETWLNTSSTIIAVTRFSQKRGCKMEAAKK